MAKWPRGRASPDKSLSSFLDGSCWLKDLDPEGKCQTKRLSFAINGCADVCLLIAPLEVQQDSFTVAEAENKPWPPAKGHVKVAQTGLCLSWNSTALSFYLLTVAERCPLNTVPSFPVESAMKTSRVQQDRWLKKKKMNSHLLLFTERLSGGLFSWPGIWLFSKRIINSFVTVGVTLMLLRVH